MILPERTISGLPMQVCMYAEFIKRQKGNYLVSMHFVVSNGKTKHTSSRDLLDLLQSRPLELASGASLVWPQSGRPLATKSREVVPRHMKSDEGLF